jgi:hypothetical protein
MLVTVAVDVLGVPPANPTGFTASDGEDGAVTLRWTNPTDVTAHNVTVLRKLGGYPTSALDGERAYVSGDNSARPLVYGAAITFVDDCQLLNDTTYYYAVFSSSSIQNPPTGNWNTTVEVGQNAGTGRTRAAALEALPFAVSTPVSF